MVVGFEPQARKKGLRKSPFIVIRLGLVIELARFDLQVEKPLGLSPINEKSIPKDALVIRLGLEPKTPTLKVLCSTN